MAEFRSQPPKKRIQQSWEYVKLEPGKSWRGWIAGPTVSVQCHSVGRNSKACRAEMTNGDLSCAYCIEGIESMGKTYVPMWSENGIHSLVIVGERYRELAERCDHLQPVKVTKLIARGCPLRVEPMPWTTLNPPVDPVLQKPQDITKWCLVVWGDPLIREWLATHRDGETTATPKAPSVNPLSLTHQGRTVAEYTPPVKGKKKKPTPEVPPIPLPTTGGDMDNAMGEVVHRLPHLKAILNGDHKPPRKPR